MADAASKLDAIRLRDRHSSNSDRLRNAAELRFWLGVVKSSTAQRLSISTSLSMVRANKHAYCRPARPINRSGLLADILTSNDCCTSRARLGLARALLLLTSAARTDNSSPYFDDNRGSPCNRTDCNLAPRRNASTSIRMHPTQFSNLAIQTPDSIKPRSSGIDIPTRRCGIPEPGGFSGLLPPGSG